MSIPEEVNDFLSGYDEKIMNRALKLRELVLANLSGIIEQVDGPARLIGYCYGQKYAELICVIIPSKKGLKLGFGRGTKMPDPDHLLEGTAKLSRYVDIKTDEQINAPALRNLILSALDLYRQELAEK